MSEFRRRHRKDRELLTRQAQNKTNHHVTQIEITDIGLLFNHVERTALCGPYYTQNPTLHNSMPKSLF